MPLPPMHRGQRNAVALAKARREFVEALTLLRKGRGKSAAAVAKDINRHRSSVSRFEAGESDPRLSTVFRYAHAVGAMISIDVIRFEDWEARAARTPIRTVTATQWADDNISTSRPTDPATAMRPFSLGGAR